MCHKVERPIVERREKSDIDSAHKKKCLNQLSKIQNKSGSQRKPKARKITIVAERKGGGAEIIIIAAPNNSQGLDGGRGGKKKLGRWILAALGH